MTMKKRKKEYYLSLIITSTEEVMYTDVPSVTYIGQSKSWFFNGETLLAEFLYYQLEFLNGVC